jgi:hypothetical protein
MNGMDIFNKLSQEGRLQALTGFINFSMTPSNPRSEQ